MPKLRSSLILPLEFSSSAPSAPSDGVRLFTRAKARRVPAFIGPAGADRPLQPGLHAARVMRWTANNNSAPSGTDAIQHEGFNSTVVGGAAISSATTDFYSRRVRGRFTTAGTSGDASGMRQSGGALFFSSTANDGGFFYVCRFGLATVATGTRGFVGLSTTTAQLSATTDPSALLNLVGFGWDAGDTQVQFMCNDGSGTATKVALGSAFPTSSAAATNWWEVQLFAPAGGGQSVRWCATRLNDNTFVSDSGAVTSNLPAVDTFMRSHFHISNGTNAAAHSMDCGSIYMETDN